MSAGVTGRTLYVDRDLGRIFIAQALARGVSLPGRPTREPPAGEFGIFVAKQHRPVYRDGHLHDASCDVLTCGWKQLEASGAGGLIERMELLWSSITHNERVDQGAVQQDVQLFGSATTNVFTAVAVASASITKTKTDLSLGSASAAVTTNEFTTIGLSRAAGTLGTYTAPSTLGGQFSRVISKVFSVTGSGTAYGGGLFDRTATASSNLYVEDLFGSSAVVVSGDSLTEQVTISN
jgi:hypothetical protein